MKIKETILCLMVLFIISFILLGFIYNNEHLTGYGTVFGLSGNPSPRCTHGNNCFPGYYYRSQIYQNMCSPNDPNGLLRDKIQLVDGCVKTLANNLPQQLEQNLRCKYK